MPRVPSEGVCPEPLESLGGEALPPVTRGGNDERLTFSERKLLREKLKECMESCSGRQEGPS